MCQIEEKVLSGFAVDELASLSGLSDKLLKSLETAFIRYNVVRD